MPTDDEHALDVVDPQGRVTRFALDGRSAVLGRSESVDVQLDSGTVSRRHAKVSCDGAGRWWVKDLGSRNGTMLNGRAVSEAALAPGDTIQIEEFLVRFQAPATVAGDGPGATGGPPDQTTVVMVDAGADEVHRLGEMASPKIDARHLGALTHFSRTLLATADAQRRRELLCDLLVGAPFSGRAAMVLRLSTDERADRAPRVVCGPRYAEHDYDRADPHVSRTLMAAVRRDRDAVVATNAARPLSADAVELSIASDVVQMAAVACPVRTDGETMDAVYATFPAQYGTPEWLSLAKLAADLYEQAEASWLARAHAERQAAEQAAIRHELEQARRIQRGLIPQAVQSPGLDVAIQYESCFAVGGDYADVLAFEQGRVFMIIADVCGKGIQAALVTTSVHAMVHSNVKPGAELLNVTQRLNDYLVASLPANSFVTMITMMIDLEAGAIELCNCGHPPALIVDAGGSVRRLQMGVNPPLGFMAPLELEPQRVAFGPGELLAVYTDGLNEMPIGPEESQLGIAGVEELIGSIRRSSDRAAGAWAEELASGLAQRHAAGGPRDDQCFVLVRRVLQESTG